MIPITTMGIKCQVRYFLNMPSFNTKKVGKKQAMMPIRPPNTGVNFRTGALKTMTPQHKMIQQKLVAYLINRWGIASAFIKRFNKFITIPLQASRKLRNIAKKAVTTAKIFKIRFNILSWICYKFFNRK